jgi:hypothetical protein
MCFIIKNSTFRPKSAFICSVYFSRRVPVISVNRIDCSFALQAPYMYCYLHASEV